MLRTVTGVGRPGDRAGGCGLFAGLVSCLMEEEILYAQIDPEKARNKRVVREPNRHAIDRMADRRPEMYELLTRPHDLKVPGRK